jgi:hypothetical protein
MRFVKKDASQRHYVMVSRIATFVLLIVAAFVAMTMTSIVGAFKFIMTIGAGTGLVYILRWFWWRINAWSEVTAMAASFVTASVLMLMGYSSSTNHGFSVLMIVTTVVSTVSWVIVTFLTAPVPDNHLEAFYRRVQPGGVLWKRIADRIPASELKFPKPHLGLDFLNWILGSLSVWLFLFGIGRLILGPASHGFLMIAAGAALFAFIYFALSRAERKR